uniref:Uncharacterized protein n=1 Tax=Aceria tosichella TaxID=561515 RepID=A0A6G1SMM0_9ACAR
MPMSLFLPGYSLSSKLESRDATIIIGWYTLILHFLAAFYFLDIYRGNNSDWIPSPIFEYSTDTMYAISLGLAIYSVIYIILASLGLVKGVKTETRIYYFPWFIFTAMEILLLIYQAFLLWWKYSYDVGVNVMVMALIIFTCYHIYLYLIVLSNYRYLKRIQSPTLIFPVE